PNLYGVTSSRLHGNLPTDRLVAEWHLDSPRVKAALAGSAPRPVVNAARITLPVTIGELRQEAPDAAREIQTPLRHAFENQFSRGFAVTGFEIAEGNASYLLEPYED